MAEMAGSERFLTEIKLISVGALAIRKALDLQSGW